MKKRIKLRGWVLVVLKFIMAIDIFFMICEAETVNIMFWKTVITLLILIPTLYLLSKYGGFDEKNI